MDLTEKDGKIKVEPLGLILGKHKNCCNDGPKGLSIREAAAFTGLFDISQNGCVF